MALASPPALRNLLQRTFSAGYATKAADAAKSVAVTTGTDWKAVKVPAETLKDMPEATGGAAFKGDLRATSGLGLGDGIHSHTAKWLQVIWGHTQAGPCLPAQGNRRDGKSCMAMVFTGRASGPAVLL